MEASKTHRAVTTSRMHTSASPHLGKIPSKTRWQPVSIVPANQKCTHHIGVVTDGPWLLEDHIILSSARIR